MNIVAVTQARVSSTRLPNKVLIKIKGQTLLNLHVNRIKKSKRINSIIVATTKNNEDDIIKQETDKLNVTCFRGESDDVLDRYYMAVKKNPPDYIVRLTSDCPLIDGELIDSVIKKTIDSRVDYCSNTLIESFPDGQDIEVFTFQALKKSWEESILKSDREHVTPFIKKNSNFYNKKKFKVVNFHSNNIKYYRVRMTVDEKEDLMVIKNLVNKLGTENNWKTYSELYLNNYSINKINSHIIRNEGYSKSLKEDI